MVAGTADAITMVECGGKEIPESRMVEALLLAHENVRKICAAIEELKFKAGQPKAAHVVPAPSPWIRILVDQHGQKISAALLTTVKHERAAAVKSCRDALIAELSGGDESKKAEIKAAFSAAKDEVFRELILQGKRVDGRDTRTVRPIVIDLDVLPRSHGSALFTRGETQALVTATLGTADDEQMLESLKPKVFDQFLLHYNFPGFSVGEVGGKPGPGRREIGHGALAKRALAQVLPSRETWPYTLRLVSDILESNGSSSMASVCGGSLALMAAGVPLTAPVAGIAMGLVKEGPRYAILTDILGDEDHYGDMDFKVAGTRKGITALQMDIKIAGLNPQILSEALEQARKGRLFILDKMEEIITEPRNELSKYAPRILTIQIPVDKIREVIGPGGKVIRGIQEKTGAKIDISDDGKVAIATPNGEAGQAALQMIRDLTAEAEIGQTYLGTVSRIVDFGAFVEIFPGTDGLLHVSEIADYRVRDVRDELHEGQQIMVKCIGVEGNKIRLSRKAVLKDEKKNGKRRDHDDDED